MKEITILSGKGGTGKTTVTACFAALASSRVLVDADVDAANLYMIVPHTVEEEHPFQGGNLPKINIQACTQCGECMTRCRYGAIEEGPRLNRIACEGCGVCAHFCPEGAITMEPRVCGTWFNSSTENGPLIHARLGIAEENSGLLVSLLRREARKKVEETASNLILVDGPPGIGCPVIAATTGCDAVVVVTEPTVSGLHDLERVAELTAFLKVPAMITINRWDIHPMMAERIRDVAKEKGMHHLGDIPVDEAVTASMVQGKPLVTCSDGPAATAIRAVWQQVVNFLDEKRGPLKMAL